MLAQALYALERYREAERLCTASRKTAAPDDLPTQVIWRGVRAKLLARRGKTAEAEELAQEALALAGRTDLFTRQADLLLDLAEVLRASDRADDADAAVAEALARYIAKGNTVGAGRARLLVAVDAR
jgi:tetratricopeptide (TPR) repeat protein